MPHLTLRTRLLAPLLLLAPACSSPGPQPLPEDPARALTTIEDNMLGADSVRSFSRLSAEGALQAELRCEHQLTRDGRVRVRIMGMFAGRYVDVQFSSDGKTMRMESDGEVREAPAPPDLWGAFLVGLTRTGLMHNVTLLVLGGVPEGADGQVRSWLGADQLEYGEQLDLEGLQARSLAFGVTIGGKSAGAAVLWAGMANGLPLERWQQSYLPEGELRVTERYEQLELNGLLEW